MSVLGIFQLQAQNTPKINGVPGGISIGGLHDFQSKFVATGCPNGYDWTFKTANGFVGDLAADWDIAYGTGTGSNFAVDVFTVSLGIGEGKDPYYYSVQCKNSLEVAEGPTTVVWINMNKFASTTDPKPRQIEKICADIENPNSGGVTLKAEGCYERTIWTQPNGVKLTSGNNYLTLTGAYQEGTYKVVCLFDNVVSPTVIESKEGSVGGILRAYAPPAISASAEGPVDQWTKEICKGEGKLITSSISDAKYIAYQKYFDFKWMAGDYGAESKGATGVNTNKLTAFQKGSYRLTARSLTGCGTSESNGINIWYIELKKPVIAGNSNFCLDSFTTLSVDSASLVLNEGYLMPAKKTYPVKFRWYVDGLEDTKLGNLSSIKVSSNQVVTVDYISSYDCQSDQSDAKTIINYARPKTPTITALTKLGFCEGTPIAAKLQSSLDSLSGAATKFLWSNALTTREVDINKAGLYTVKVIDINECVSLSSDATEVKVLPLPAAPVIAAGGPTIFCQRADADFGTFNSVTLTATSVNDVTWYGKLSTAKLLAGKVLAGVKTSDTYFTTATDLNGCISKNSNEIKVTVQTNPAITSDTKIAKEGVYTIKALNFPSAATANATSAGEYEWKFGSAALISKTFVSKVKTAGDYTTRRKYLYTIEGTPLTCWTDLVKYAYVVDPEFKGVAIYPNPITSSNVTIEILEDWTGADVSIYDMVGRPVFAGKIASSDGTDGRNTLNVGGLGNGIYILQVKSTADKSYVGKIIVNK
ncbi:MAG: T9SS type A sorting domain-containing protein [Cytophagales bacterium]|nr:T9SS type A sorting domain-containing protein [Cytophagales bacterium]